MTKPIYRFANTPFRDQLAEHYILPVAGWLLGPSESPFLLPQIAGSTWECALTLEFFSRLAETAMPGSKPMLELALPKCERTATWMLDQLDEGCDGRKASWDGNMWDTAVACQAVIAAYHAGYLTEVPRVAARVASVGRWLCDCFGEWGAVVRYVDAPADLAQALKAILMIHAS